MMRFGARKSPLRSCGHSDVLSVSTASLLETADSEIKPEAEGTDGAETELGRTENEAEIDGAETELGRTENETEEIDGAAAELGREIEPKEIDGVEETDGAEIEMEGRPEAEAETDGKTPETETGTEADEFNGAVALPAVIQAFAVLSRVMDMQPVVSGLSSAKIR